MKKLLLFAIIVLALSCKKESESNIIVDPIIAQEQIYLLKKTFRNAQLTSERSYDVDSLLQTITYYKEDGSLFNTHHYVYDNDTIKVRVLKDDNELLQDKHYFRTSNLTVRMNKYNANDLGALSDYRVYSFTNDTCGYTNLSTYSANGTIGSQFNFEFLDENCSVSGSFMNTAGTILSKDQSIRDGQRVYVHSRLLDLLDLNRIGSTIERRSWDENNELSLTASYNAVVEYNDAGYPISEIRTYLDATVDTFSFEYF